MLASISQKDKMLCDSIKVFGFMIDNLIEEEIMKKLDVKQHTKKCMDFAKKTGDGSFPNKEVVKVDSMVGLGIGEVLLGVGIYGISQSAVYGTGSLVVGAVAGISNGVNLKRIKRKK
ncbi:hypothetical protein [Clostridium botulinum]|nr:hypothetical protein [Clostridium botulinum]